jgi:CBS domain-containing protein
LKKNKVIDLIVPLSEYATVSEDATIFEATLALERAQEKYDAAKYRHRAVLVQDKKGKIVGKLSQIDVLRSLEPKYLEMQERPGYTKTGFSKKFMLSLIEDYQLFDKPMDDICRKGGERKVCDYMSRPKEGEFIDADASLDEAIHLFVLGHHQSLLVTRKEDIIGILRLTDVFAAIFHALKQCFISK